MASTYALSAWFFTRAIFLIYFVAFVSLGVQARGLWGSKGVLPIKPFLQAVEMQVDASRYWQLPSFFWLGSSDALVVGLAWIGAFAAILGLLGLAQGWLLLVCVALYLSYVSVGQEFLSFQWDSLLIEVGFLSLFAVPWTFGFDLWSAHEPHWTVRAMFYVVLFKLMFLSGLVKILSGDPSWRNFTALTYHYWTQPLPNPLSPYMHVLPLWLQKFSTFNTFVIELILPFFILWPRARVFVAAGFIALSLLIFSTGNYTFFNLLTIALCFWLIPDSWWQIVVDRLPFELKEAEPILSVNLFSAGVMAVLFLLSAIWCTRWMLSYDLQSRLMPLLRMAQGFHVSNSYGLFANMTKHRPEIVIEGSLDGQEWHEYEFKYKPGNLYRPLPIVEPHQPRLDWQMWFAALGSFDENPWLQNLLRRIFENEPDVMSFFLVNPFEGEPPPRFLRMRLYEYELTTPHEIWKSGQWWQREFIREYSPTFERR
jgi:hypothetical protein